jgi:methyl-accepting chemotaxis protein
MNIRQRIGSLPVISGVVFGLGIVASVLIATGALGRIDHVEAVEYPFLAAAKEAQGDIQAVTDQLLAAVAEGDATQLESAAKEAERVRGVLANIAAIPEHAAVGRQLQESFNSYYGLAARAARLMLGKEQGDSQSAVAAMQASLKELTPQVQKTVEDAQAGVSSELRSSATRVRAVLWLMIVVGVAVVLVLTITARRTTRAIWNQLGDEPEAISAAARRLAAGDITSEIAVSEGNHDSTMASMAALQARFRAVLLELNTVVDAAARGDLSRRVALEGKEGCYRDIAVSVNRWSQNSQAALKEVASLLGEIAQGKLPAPSAHRLEGEFGELQAYGENTVTVLRKLMEELNAAVGRARAGDFSKRIETHGMRGFQAELAEGINSVIQVTACGLADVSVVLEALAAGDLTQRASGNYDGAFGELAQHADSAVVQLGSLVESIRQCSQEITRVSQEITSGETGARTGATRSSLEELSATIRSNADNARQANDLAHHASTAASGGKNVVADVVTTMEGITTASKKISDIIHVIDSIAFQTNILALNAAIEAARAGEQGKGFAVVANQVGELAKRSAASARQIKNLISQSVSQVEAGASLATQAGKSMDEICGSIKRVTTFVSEMDQATQHTATLMDRTAGAARQLQLQARRLLEGVEVFKLESSARHVDFNIDGPAYGEVA